MSAPEFAVGDKVVHYRDVTRVGTVVLVRRRGWIFRSWTYFMQWEPESPAVPMRAGTWRAPDSAVQAPAVRATEAAPAA